MCWHPEYKTGKTVRRKVSKPHHSNAIPYKREKNYKPQDEEYK